MNESKLIVGLMCALGVSSLRAADTPVDPFMGDWQGEPANIVAQVISLGAGNYRANILAAFDVRVEHPCAVLDGKVMGGKLMFGEGMIEDGVFTGTVPAAFKLKHVDRLSPTLGAKPPAGAIILLGAETKDLPAIWQRDASKPCGWKLIGDGVMQCVPGTGPVITKQQFKSHKVHLEFKLPYEPDKRGQGRGNSGVYLQGRYEVQVLDSYGLKGLDNECGGIYKIGAPRVNMCAPPLQWQSYDITFHGPVMEGDKVAKFARISVLHNGVKIHEDLELPHTTTAAPFGKIGPEGGLYLQDHGHPVEYRNIWVETF